MSWWERQLNGGSPPPTGRPVSTPSFGGDTWYPTPQYRPPTSEPWAGPTKDHVQQGNMEISQDVLDFMSEDDTWTYGKTGNGIQTASGQIVSAGPMSLREFPEDVDTSTLSMHDKHEYMWQRVARAPLKGHSKALKAEPHRCPSCGGARFFTRKMNGSSGKSPAPMCMECSYTGENYSISQLN